jgi:hypothetical protein
VNLPRFRIAWLMLFVAVVALNFGAIRALSELEPPKGGLLVFGAVPMTNILAAGILIGHRRPASRPCDVGFEAFGAMALYLCVALALDISIDFYMMIF